RRTLRCPRELADVHVGEKDRVRPHAAPLELAEQPSLALGQELALTRRPHAGVDEDRPAAATDQVRPEGQPPALAVEQLRGALPPRRPVVLRSLGERLRVGRERALRVEERIDLEVTDYH